MTTEPWLHVIALGLHEHCMSEEGLRPPGAAPLSRRTPSPAGEGGALCPELVRTALSCLCLSVRGIPRWRAGSSLPCPAVVWPHLSKLKSWPLGLSFVSEGKKLPAPSPEKKKKWLKNVGEKAEQLPLQNIL